MDGGIERMVGIRRGMGRDGGMCVRSLAGRCAYSFGLVSWVVFFPIVYLVWWRLGELGKERDDESGSGG